MLLKERKDYLIYGYCRISTRQQSIERQERNIRNAFPNCVIVKEAYSGTSMERPVWKRLRNMLSSGDSVIFDELSRMSRNCEEGFTTYKELYEKNINLVFLKEPHINTDVYRNAYQGVIPMTNTIADPVLKGVNEMLLALAAEQIKLAFEQAQKEVDYLHQRTKEGLEVARLNGRQIGQRPGIKLYVYKADPIKKVIVEKSKDFKGFNNDKEVMAILAQTTISYKDKNGKTVTLSGAISRNTYYKYKRELKNNN